METYRNPGIHARATAIIKSLYGRDASFRDGQYEAIEATMTQKRTLVVQRTGWGKSLVYFVCTKLMREQGKGVTMVVSPLLVLMQNQMPRFSMIEPARSCLKKIRLSFPQNGIFALFDSSFFWRVFFGVLCFQQKHVFFTTFFLLRIEKGAVAEPSISLQLLLFCEIIQSSGFFRMRYTPF